MMLSMFSFFLLIIQLVTALASKVNSNNLQSAAIYFQDAENNLIEHGILEYDIFESSGSFNELNPVGTGLGCFGLKRDKEMFQCFILVNISAPESSRHSAFSIYIEESGKIQNLGFVQATEETKPQVQVIRGVNKGPLPDLKQPVKLVDNKLPEKEVSTPLLFQYLAF